MDKKVKEGVSVQEIENFSKKYHFEIAFTLYFILATLLSLLWELFGTKFSLFLIGIGGILGVWFPSKIKSATASTFRFIKKQERTTHLIVAVLGLLIAIFLPPLIFFLTGWLGGAGMRQIYSSDLKKEVDQEIDVD